MVRVNIGNFPPLAAAELKIYYYQMLDIEDASYSLRIPMAYIPKYMGDIASYIETGARYQGEEPRELTDEEKQENLQAANEIQG